MSLVFAVPTAWLVANYKFPFRNLLNWALVLPLAVPTFAAASALVIIGAMMMKQVVDIDWNDSEMVLPAFLTIVLMPFTYSIADGIAWGVITWVVIKMMMGKWQEPSPIMYGIAVFMLMFYLGPGDTSTFGWLFDTIGI